jgi:hypothetical protein
VRTVTGVFIPLVEQANYEGAVAAARAELGEEAFDVAWAEGRSMTPEQALAVPAAPLAEAEAHRTIIDFSGEGIYHLPWKANDT